LIKPYTQKDWRGKPNLTSFDKKEYVSREKGTDAREWKLPQLAFFFSPPSRIIIMDLLTSENGGWRQMDVEADG
jgi:hypothetical protein